VAAQESPEDTMPLLEALKEQALEITVQTKNLDKDLKPVWTRDSSWVTVPGRSVSLKLENPTMLMVTQFTPYRKGTETQLLVQTQVWIRNADKKVIQSYTHINTLVVKFAEKLLYYPLGKRKVQNGESQPEIEMTITMIPYTSPETPVTESTGQ
jgi:hypothetical protein